MIVTRQHNAQLRLPFSELADGSVFSFVSEKEMLPGSAGGFYIKGRDETSDTDKGGGEDMQYAVNMETGSVIIMNDTSRDVYVWDQTAVISLVPVLEV